MITEQGLLNQGYKKIGENKYEILDEESGMFLRYTFNPIVDKERDKKIEESVIHLITRQDL